MANLYKEYVDNLYLTYAFVWGDFQDVQLDINRAWIDWDAPDDHAALAHLINAVQYLLDGGVRMIGRGDPPCNKNWLDRALVKAWQYTIEDLPVVTWKSIVEAWVKDDFEARFWTIGVIDRMRQIMWDEPFDLTWAARPEEKEIPE